MRTALSVAIEVGLWWAVVVKLLHLRRTPDDLPLRAVTGLYVCLALGPLAAMPGLHDLVEDAVPGLSRLLLNLLTVTATYCLMAFYGHSVGGPGTASRLRRRLIGLLTVQAVMTVAWATAPLPVRISPAALENLDDRHGAVFTVAALGYMGYGLTYAFRWSMVYARAAGRVRLRTSLRIVSVALACLLTACLTKAGVALALGVAEGLTTDDPVLVGLSRVYPTLVLLGTVLLAVGFCYPAVASLPGRIVRSGERRRLHRRLGPLSQRMRDAFPHLVLSPGGAVLPGWMPWTYRAYYRRVIEIRDTMVQLAPYYDPELATAQGAVPDDAAQVRLIAVLTSDALRRKTHELPVPHPYPLPALGGDDLDSDARWLARLAAELERLERQSAEPVSSSTSSMRST
ncbi:hypothetical protein KIH74_25270 [Kineosporia sp. J2-2]|uniref:DUF6545 domain-containing protein n=1 Tax=Kineosporia corallincola TaxID=2835133 RepID=A0ABS5TMG0_9ACTN|nr:MAB_1171c family putative transporter [Kineosporia corallincola]MBT0772281.1 hypothetical protein [Kineosporia corallincola]